MLAVAVEGAANPLVHSFGDLFGRKSQVDPNGCAGVTASQDTDAVLQPRHEVAVFREQVRRRQHEHLFGTGERQRNDLGGSIGHEGWSSRFVRPGPDALTSNARRAGPAASRRRGHPPLCCVLRTGASCATCRSCVLPLLMTPGVLARRTPRLGGSATPSCFPASSRPRLRSAVGCGSVSSVIQLSGEHSSSPRKPKRSSASFTLAQRRGAERSLRSMVCTCIHPRGGRAPLRHLSHAPSPHWLRRSHRRSCGLTPEQGGRGGSMRRSRWKETGSHRHETLWDGLAYPAVEYERPLVPD